MSGTTGKIQRHLKLIIETLREHADGLSVGEIADLLSREKSVSLAPHDVAYRIRQASPNLIHGFGDGRGRRYRLAKDADVATSVSPFLIFASPFVHNNTLETPHMTIT